MADSLSGLRHSRRWRDQLLPQLWQPATGENALDLAWLSASCSIAGRARGLDWSLVETDVLAAQRAPELVHVIDPSKETK